MKLIKYSITAIIVLTLIFTAPSLRAQDQADNSPGTRLGARNLDGGSQAYGEVTETIPQEGVPDSGGSSSQERPAVTASDPSMWEEQSHRECSPEKDEYGLDKYKCNLATLHRPTQPDQPTTTSGGGARTVTITTRQAATLIASGSGITRQPPGPKVIISKAFIVYTNPAVRYQTTTILGTPIEVEFTPTSYTWGWGDGTTTTTTDPGAPYPHPPLPAHRHRHHHHPDHELDHEVPPRRREPVAAHRGHHHHHRDLHPLRPGPRRHLPHRRRRRSPRPLTLHTQHPPTPQTTRLTPRVWCHNWRLLRAPLADCHGALAHMHWSEQ